MVITTYSYMARNPDRSWWHRHTSLNLFGRSPTGMAKIRSSFETNRNVNGEIGRFLKNNFMVYDERMKA